MVHSILWRLIGCFCFWWSLGLALFFISFGVNRIEEAVRSGGGATAELVSASQRSGENIFADVQDSVQREGNTGKAEIWKDVTVQVSGNGSERFEKTAAVQEKNSNIAQAGNSSTNTDNTEKPSAAGCVALTFDDGPHPVYTPQLLDGLKESGVCATFFVVGENIPGNEEILKRMEAEGHLIGNHTYDHVKLSDLDSARACAEVEKTNALIQEATGKEPEFIRPPFGAWKKTMECSLGMLPVLWDVDPLDWTTKNTALIVERVLEETEPGDIILLHDYYQSSVDAALEIVDALTEKGYEFVTVDELILE